MNVTQPATPFEQMKAIADEARHALATAEARIATLLDRATEIAETTAKDQAQMRHHLEGLGLESSIFNRSALRAESGTGPLFDLDAIRAVAEELRNDVERSGALQSNIALALSVLQDTALQLSAERAFCRAHETVDIRVHQAMNSAREDERRRLAREIHDGPAQVLSNAIFAVHTAEQIAKRAPQQVADELAHLRELLKDGVAEIRRFMFDLRPTMLQDLGLGPTLARYIDDYSRFFGNKVILAVQESLPALPPEHELHIFRVVQEALQNVHKHAGAGAEANVALYIDGTLLILTISDDGRGFNPGAISPRPGGGAGMPGMRERASLVNGEIHFESEPGKGTIITLKMPLRGHTGPLRH